MPSAYVETVQLFKLMMECLITTGSKVMQDPGVSFMSSK
jgi:hypothetical protein